LKNFKRGWVKFVGERVRRIVEMIDGAVQVPPHDPVELHRRWSSLEPEVEKILRALRQHPQVLERMKNIVVGLNRAAASLSEFISLAGSGNGLEEDWRRFAERHAIELKDWLLGLREFLVSRSHEIELGLFRQELEESATFDVERLFDELRKAGLISEGTWLRIREVVSNPEWSPSPEVIGAVRRIARAFLEILKLGEADGKE